MTAIPRVLRAPDARQDIHDGLAMAGARARPRQLDRMADEDLRWDQLCDRAIATILPDVAKMLDVAIAAEWQRMPIEL